MGEKGCKLLLPLAGTTIVESSARAPLEALCRLIVVVGCWADEVAALFEAEAYRELRREGRLLFVENRLWERGMVSSIQAALASVLGDAFFVAQGDMPFAEAGSYRLLAAAREGDRRLAYAASHGGRAGHPVLLPSAWIPGILALEGGERLRPFVEARGLRQVEAGPAAVEDIDDPEDYEAAIAGPRQGML
jgi:CTP:molybdopterin cytidylyltransferase MocA